MTILNYTTGEPVHLGDSVFLPNGEPAILGNYVLMGSPLSEIFPVDYIGFLFYKNDNSTFFLDAIPENFLGVKKEDKENFFRIWNKIKFDKRGTAMRYSNSNNIVKLGDIIAVWDSGNSMRLCQVSTIVLGRPERGYVMAKDTTSISNTGILITDKIYGEKDCSSIEFLNDDNYMSYDWEHVHFVYRGTLTPRLYDGE